MLARCRERATFPAEGVARLKTSIRAAWLATYPEAWFASFAAAAPGLERLRT